VTAEDEWLWGWDPTPGIVSVWAEDDGRACVWRRIPGSGELVMEKDRFRPWLLLRNLADVGHLGDTIDTRELGGPGELRFLVTTSDYRALCSAITDAASRRLGRPINHVRELHELDELLALQPDEQYLVSTGRNYFRDLTFDDLRRLQFDLETSGLDADRDRVFLISVRHPDGRTETLETASYDNQGEADLIRRLAATIQASDPDVIENHNLHGFDLPFLDQRSRRLRIPLSLGRVDTPGFKRRGARRGAPSGRDDGRRVRMVAPGRELIDTMDAVRRFDQSTRELPS
jgi:DNA polymerase elongation subunit (family B)